MKRPSNNLWLTVLLSIALPAGMGLWWRVYLGHPPLDAPPTTELRSRPTETNSGADAIVRASAPEVSTRNY